MTKKSSSEIFSWEIDFFISRKIRNFLEISLKKLEFFTQIHDHQIWNQINAADSIERSRIWSLLTANTIVLL